MRDTYRTTSADRVPCRCPDGRHGRADLPGSGIERVRAVAMRSEDGGWVAWATQHGPGTDCGEGNGERWSYLSNRFATREEAVVWANERCR